MVNRLVYASGLDASLDGYAFDNFTIKIDYKDKFKHIPIFVDGSTVSYWDAVPKQLLRFHNPLDFDSFYNNSMITKGCPEPDAYVAVFEYADTNDSVFSEYNKKYHHLINCCRIFKPSRIGFSQAFSAFDKDGQFFPEQYAYARPTAVYGANGDNFCLSDDERIEFAQFFQETYTHFPYVGKELMGLDDERSTSLMPKMFKIFHQSFSIKDVSTAALLRTIILEMLIDGNAELTYRLARSIAVLLGESSEQAVIIEKEVKKLYGARSKYIHAGKSVEKEDAALILKTTCALLKKLYNITDDIKTIRNKLNQGGFGSLPYG